MLHTFDAPFYMKNEKYMKKRDFNHGFHVFLIFRVVRSIESMKHGYSFNEESNFAFSKCFCSKFDC